ncbi:hypothetical protein BCV70DRAFT_233956 [Testicularia cyperi]|uniref:Uncharacterized protein n=1 Tax=Testicularia cyperi TaxID=1882483 RepID=A0A317XHK2_9BASI|nr:hypothetical protein BCV70DRAFT_233956 [Testicularia cyperi]
MSYKDEASRPTVVEGFQPTQLFPTALPHAHSQRSPTTSQTMLRVLVLVSIAALAILTPAAALSGDCRITHPDRGVPYSNCPDGKVCCDGVFPDGTGLCQKADDNTGPGCW